MTTQQTELAWTGSSQHMRIILTKGKEGTAG